MNQKSKKNLKLCEKLKIKNDSKCSFDFCTIGKEKQTKCKQKVNKYNQNTFSMINFYESIPSMNLMFQFNLNSNYHN